MQTNREKMYILCGLAGKGENDVRNALIEKAEKLGYEAVCVSRYRKEGIRQYIAEHPEFRIVLLQESMQSSYPYTAEELAELMDDYNLNIIVSLNKSHKANPYMKILYAAGILNALFEEDATASNIMNLILYPRTRRACREYYQITNAADVMETLEIVDEQKMKGFAEYIEESDTDSEILDKYRYVAKSVKIIENIYLARHLSEHVKTILAADDEFQKYLMLQKKKRWGPFGRKRNRSRERPTPVKAEPALETIQTGVLSERGEVHTGDRNSVDEMVDEDISDLLGFDSEEQVFEPQEFYPISESYEFEDQHAKKKPKERSGVIISPVIVKIFAIIAIVLFLALTILVGFFLFADYQASKETVTPVISESKKNEDTDIQDKIEVHKTEPVLDEEKVQEKEETENEDPLPLENNSGVTDKADSQTQDTKKAEAPQEPSPNQESAEVSTEQEEVSSSSQEHSVSISTSQSDPVQEMQQAEQPVSYVGQILTGSEVVAAATAEEQRGTRLYLKTRENGEGYFSASVIAGMVDSTCSYLVEGSGGVQISFIQQ